MRLARIVALVLGGCALCSHAQSVPPWSKGANDPATDRGYVFHVDDVDNMPDLHGNPANAQLVLFIGGNQFFVLPQLIYAFVHQHPELKGHIFYETLPPGILRRQIAANDTITLGNLTLKIKPDVFEAGAHALTDMEKSGQIEDVVQYATNNLEIMVHAGNPKRIYTLADLARPGLRLSMPNPQWEGVAAQIADSLRKAGGEALNTAVYRDKVKNGTTRLTEIHHRQTPMRIMNGSADAGVTWASEVRFQQSIGNPIEGVAIPDAQNTTAIYAGGILKDSAHKRMAAAWLHFLKSEPAQDIYRQYGFNSPPQPRE
ncbi:MAG TPA: substrate-binding domain-containing protein [Terracidiphilus sp.]|nr:substrate-binding domain-containing protein [Terracidiphilus sp.]